MKTKAMRLSSFCLILIVLLGLPPQKGICQQKQLDKTASIIFLHHSTGEHIWGGGVPEWFELYNRKNHTYYKIVELSFPSGKPYPWQNYPYDYWNIWIKHGGKQPFMEEPTLEILTTQYDVIVFKHCFPVSNIKGDFGRPDVSSPEKRIGNYMLQYKALKQKMREFPKTKFIVWTGATLTKQSTSLGSARLAREFFDWVKNEWDEKGDNIYVWDFYSLETDTDGYMKDEHADSPADSHPNSAFSRLVAPLFAQRIVDVIEGRGDAAAITGRK